MPDSYAFSEQLPVAPLKIAALKGCMELADKVNKHIVTFRQNDMKELAERKESLHYRGYERESE